MASISDLEAIAGLNSNLQNLLLSINNVSSNLDRIVAGIAAIQADPNYSTYFSSSWQTDFSVFLAAVSTFKSAIPTWPLS